MLSRIVLYARYSSPLCVVACASRSKKHFDGVNIQLSGFVTLGEIGALLSVLHVSCNRCDRLGRHRTARLMLQHGADLPLTRLRHIIAADCPRMVAGRLHDVCGVHFPGLAGMA